MKLDDLSNEEIVFIHLLVENRLELLNTVLDKGGITFVLDSPLGRIEVFGQFTDQELKDIREGIKYKLATNVVNKLEPVYDLIADTNIDIINKVKKALFPDEEDTTDDN